MGNSLFQEMTVTRNMKRFKKTNVQVVQLQMATAKKKKKGGFIGN